VNIILISCCGSQVGGLRHVFKEFMIYILVATPTWSRDSSVGTANGYWLDDRMIGV
jgi:hypothetical protein